MIIILDLFARTMDLLITAILGAMFFRAIFPIFFDTEDNLLYDFFVYLTEPVVLPVRLLFVRLNIGQNSPIDFSYFASYLLLVICRGFLPVLS